MDHRRFDNLARGFARDRDRRGFVRVALGVAVALLTPTVVRSAAEADCPEGCTLGAVCAEGTCGQPCENHRDCRSKHDDPCVANTCVEGRCRSAIADCIPGYECCKGECCPKSCDVDVECAVFDPCRRGECAADGFCFFTVFEPCDICQSDLDCPMQNELNTVCCAGMCKRPCPVGTVMSKGCECRADSSGTDNGLVVRDDASG